MDIIFQKINRFNTLIKSATTQGYRWIRENMYHRDDYTVVIDSDYEEEWRDKMRKDGLTV